MKKDFMEMLKNKYNAWLIVSIPESQDYNGEVVDNFFIFTENEVLTTYKNNKENYSCISEKDDLNNLKQANSLYLHFDKLNGLLNKLDGERKSKLENILTEIEPKYRTYEKIMGQRSIY